MEHAPVLGAMAALVAITWLWGRAGQLRLAKQARVLEQMLAKFQSGQELGEFLETETGPCPREETTARSIRTGEWSDELAAHVAECASCRESGRLVRWLTELAEQVDAECTPLPDPHLVWLKASIAGRSRRLERALLPLRIAHALMAAGLGAVVGHLGTRAWHSMGEWLASGGTLVPELPDLPVPSLLATLWIPVAILLPLLIATTET